VAQHGAGSAGQYGGHPVAVPRERSMADGVHAAVDPVQPAPLHVTGDAVAAEAEVVELAARDDTVLARREGRPSRSRDHASDVLPNRPAQVGRVSHASMVTARACRRTARSQRFCTGAVASMLAP